MEFKNIDIIRIKSGLGVGLLAADIGGFQKEWIAPIVHGERVVGAGTGKNPHCAAMVASAAQRVGAELRSG